MKAAMHLIAEYLSPPPSPSKDGMLSDDSDEMMSVFTSQAFESVAASPPISPASSPYNGGGSSDRVFTTISDVPSASFTISDLQCQTVADTILKTPELRPQANEWIPSIELGDAPTSSWQLSYSSEDETVDSCEHDEYFYDDYLNDLGGTRSDRLRDLAASKQCLAGGYSYNLGANMLQQIASELRPLGARGPDGRSLRFLAGPQLPLLPQMLNKLLHVLGLPALLLSPRRICPCSPCSTAS